MGEKWYTQIAWAEFNKDIIYLKAKHIWINSKEWDIILGLARIESCHYPWSKQEQPHCPIGQGWTNMEPQSEHPSLTPFPPWWRLSLVWLKWSEWERKKKKKAGVEITEITESNDVGPCMLLRTGFYSEWDENPQGNSSREGKWSN